MTRVAVTGGAGFIGTNLVLGLLSRNFEVVVIDDFSTGLQENLKNTNCEIRVGSLTNRAFVEDSTCDVSYVFHLAARGSVPRSIADPLSTFDANALGTLNVLEAVRKNRISMAFSSSSSVYGRNNILPKSEKMWQSPLTPYGASKLAGEAFVASYSACYDLNLVSYRFFNVYGPWQRPDHPYAAVIPKWIWKALNNEEIEIYGDGKSTRDFTYVETVVQVLLDGMTRDLRHETPINLAFGNRISLRELATQIQELAGYQLQIHHGSYRLGDIRDSQNDPTLLNATFPNITPVDFSNGLAKTFNWFKENSQLFLGKSSKLE